MSRPDRACDSTCTRRLHPFAECDCSRSQPTKRYNVVQYAANGNFMGIMSGMGKNAGTWDADHPRSAAYRHAAQCRKDIPYCIFKVEEA